MNYDCIPEHIPYDCEVVVNEKVERFLDDARKMNLLTTPEFNLLNHIENLKEESTLKTGKNGTTFLFFPPLSDILVESELSYS